MKELLTSCGIKESELPRCERALARLGINDEDVARGKQRLKKYYDTSLEGVRKSLRLCVLEAVDSLLVREERDVKILAGYMAPAFDEICGAVASKSKDVFAVQHSGSIQMLLSCILGKMDPIMEAAEKKWTKAGMVAHCGNVKAFLGLIASETIPKPDLAITSGTHCETAPKTLDLLQELYGIPICCADSYQDRLMSNFSEDTTRSVELGAKSYRELAEKIREVTGVETTDAMLSEFLEARGQMEGAIRKLRAIVETSDPLPLSASHENIWRCLTHVSFTLDTLPEAVDAINTATAEIQDRIDRGIGVVEKGAPRLLGILPEQHSDPRLAHLTEELGMAIVGTDNGYIVPFEWKSKDPFIELSQRLMHSSIGTPLPRRLGLVIEGCRRLKVDGVLDRMHIGCRTVAADAIILKEAVEKEVGIPVLLLEWENFDPRVFNYNEYKRRLEAFKALMVK